MFSKFLMFNALSQLILLNFRDKFNASSILKQQKVKPGGVAVNKFGDRFIYNLVTKSLSYHKPTYQILSESLYAMRDHMLQHNVKYLAMPRIGSGLDGLVWEKVRDLIVETFENDDVEIMVYKYVPLKAN